MRPEIKKFVIGYLHLPLFSKELSADYNKESSFIKYSYIFNTCIFNVNTVMYIQYVRLSS